MKKVLCIVGNLNQGGAETFLMKIYRGIDKSSYEMDFCVQSTYKGVYEDEILSSGSKVYHSRKSAHSVFGGFNNIRKITKAGRYKSVLVSSGSAKDAFIHLLAARLGGAKVLVVRSSTSNVTNPRMRFLHKLFKPMLSLLVNIRVAPSKTAAEWMFGKQAVNKRRVMYIKNAVDIEVFNFNASVRTTKRLELNVEGRLVIGHIGRFNAVKNHKFLLEVFAEVKKIRNDAVLILVGSGALQREMEIYAREMNVLEDVKFLGLRDDIPELLMAMDSMVFPSFYEGMPNVLIESQATGLKCFASDTITSEANITGLIEYLSLDLPAEEWAKKVIGNIDGQRLYTKEKFVENGYEIQSTVHTFTKNIFK